MRTPSIKRTLSRVPKSTSFIVWQNPSDKSVCFDWFFLGRDFAVRTVSIETVQAVVLEQSRQIRNLQPKTAKKYVNIVILHSETTRKSKKIEILLRFQRMDEEDEHSPRYLEIFDAETETGIAESQEAKDDFINQQKSVNINKKTATDMKCLFSAALKLMV